MKAPIILPMIAASFLCNHSILAAAQSHEKSVPHAAPSFDCKRASDIAEKLICQHDDLAELDQELTNAYAAALKRLDAKGDAALRQEQGWFNHLRAGIAAPDYAFDDAPPHDRLKSLLQSRRDFLLSIRKAPDDQTGMRQMATGRWENYFGLIEIQALKKRRGGVSATAVDPYSARWTCEFEDDGFYHGETLIIDRRSTKGAMLSFARDGDLLIVTEKFKEGEGSPSYCGYRGTLAGSYFFTKKK